MKLEIKVDESDIFTFAGNGSLKAWVSRFPKYPSDDWYIKEKEDYLPLSIFITIRDLRALNLEMFCVVIGKGAQLEGYGIKYWSENEEQIISEFPMISKMKWTSAGIFNEVIYKPQEVNQLFQECLRIKSFTKNLSADLATRKLIYSCNEALKFNFFLFLFCD